MNTTDLTANAALTSATTLPADHLLIQNALILDPERTEPLAGDMLIKNGIITAIEPSISNADTDIAILDANNAWISPHFIDLGAQLREPGYEHKGTLLREAQAAFQGGFSDLAMLPDTIPVLDAPAVIGLVQDKAKLCPVNIWPIAALTVGLNGQQLSEIFALKEAGCIAVTQSRASFRDNRLALRCLEYIATTGLKVFFYSEDAEIAGDGCAHEGPIADRLGFPGIPECAETTAIARDLLLVERTGVSAHFGHLSSAKSLELILEAQNKGLDVTADVALTHIAFDETALLNFDPQFHLRPPLRSRQDRQALLKAVNHGQISISIGHQPQDIAAKTAPFSESAEGMSLYDTHIPLANRLIQAKELEVLPWVRALTTSPARILNLKGWSSGLKVGQPARFNVISQETWIPNKENCCSMAGNIFGFRQTQIGRLQYRVIPC